jgi:hypothetical protein
MRVEDVPGWLATEEPKKEGHPPGLIKGDCRYCTLVDCRIAATRQPMLEDKIGCLSRSLFDIRRVNVTRSVEADDRSGAVRLDD